MWAQSGFILVSRGGLLIGGEEECQNVLVYEAIAHLGQAWGN